MTMGRATAASGARDPFAVDERRAMEALRMSWGGSYDLAVVGGTWTAVTRDGEGRILCGDTPDELDRAIRLDWEAMQ
jgi:hypothetical protein